MNDNLNETGTQNALNYMTANPLKFQSCDIIGSKKSRRLKFCHNIKRSNTAQCYIRNLYGLNSYVMYDLHCADMKGYLDLHSGNKWINPHCPHIFRREISAGNLFQEPPFPRRNPKLKRWTIIDISGVICGGRCPDSSNHLLLLSTHSRLDFCCL